MRLRFGSSRKRPETNLGYRVTVVPLEEELVGDVRAGVVLLGGAVLLLLAIAAVNVAGLLSVRARQRRRELALRSVLGASRAGLGRLLWLEGLVLATVGAALGLGLASIGLRRLPALVAGEIPRLADAGVDGRAVTVTLVLALIVGSLTALVPAWRAGRDEPALRLRSGGGAGGAGSGARGLQTLVLAQVGLAMVLVVCSTLLARSFLELRAVDPGFEKDRLLSFEVQPPGDRYTTRRQLVGFYDELISAAAALPGAISATLAYDHPLSSNWTQSFAIEGEAYDPGDTPGGPLPHGDSRVLRDPRDRGSGRAWPAELGRSGIARRDGGQRDLRRPLPRRARGARSPRRGRHDAVDVGRGGSEPLSHRRCGRGRAPSPGWPPPRSRPSTFPTRRPRITA